MIPFPEKKYSVIYADPPWNYAAGGKTRNVERHYRTMKPEDIYSLPVQDIAEDDCLLFLWATFPNLDGDVYVIYRRKPVKAKVIFIGINADKLFFFNVLRGNIKANFQTYQFTENDIGRSVFLTLEEAEKAVA